MGGVRGEGDATGTGVCEGRKRVGGGGGGEKKGEMAERGELNGSTLSQPLPSASFRIFHKATSQSLSQSQISNIVSCMMFNGHLYQDPSLESPITPPSTGERESENER